jgi:hypothetical protein
MEAAEKGFAAEFGGPTVDRKEVTAAVNCSRSLEAPADQEIGSEWTWERSGMGIAMRRRILCNGAPGSRAIEYFDGLITSRYFIRFFVNLSITGSATNSVH